MLWDMNHRSGAYRHIDNILAMIISTRVIVELEMRRLISASVVIAVTILPARAECKSRSCKNRHNENCDKCHGYFFHGYGSPFVSYLF